jgi:acyl-CoA synthetase (AMP-forming)/AMP-acid ligase II
LTVPQIASATRVEERFRTLPDALDHWSRQRTSERALSQGDEELGYGDLFLLVDEAAQRLAGAGARAGERIALLGGNTVEWVVSFLAALRLGAVAVPLNIRLGPLELRRQLDVSEPRLVLASETLLPLAEGLGLATGEALLVLERDSKDPRSLWGQQRAKADGRAIPATAPALISFTSGTTGPPKGAVIEHGALVRSASAFVPRLQTTSSDTTLVLAPLFHNTGFADQLTQMVLVGGAIDLLPEFRIVGAVAALLRRSATYLIAVPSVFRLLMLHEQGCEALAGCRVAVYGGAPMPAGWIAELARGFPQLLLFNCYGLTEFTSVSHLLDPEHALARRNSVGRPVAGVRQLVVDADGKEVAPGEAGEVWLSGPTRMAGYFRDPAATRAVFRGEWLRTGDLGSLDDDFLVLRGRSAEVINRGGEKIHATQVEAALCELSAVADAAVVGAPHPILGERVVAWVVAREGHDLDEDSTRAHLSRRVADYAVPEEFVLADELPRNAAGKLDRTALQAEAVRLFPGEES